ncbi:hypothetical protein R3P38DRAFT_2589387, partial [Favolaschia claudopus]
MASEPIFTSLLRRLEAAGHTFLAHSAYNRDFVLSSVDIVSPSDRGSLRLTNSVNYVTPNSTSSFCPVVFGEIKEIMSVPADPLHERSLCLNIGFPTGAWNEVDTLMWNQLSELDFVMRRDAADNDCLLPDADFGSAYKNITHTIPWSTGPTGESSDRMFLRL